MRKILFACDLDNTLILSHRKKREGDLCVEILNGEEQSFMPHLVYEALQDLAEKVYFVPVTTRSMEQYVRIQLLSKGCPEYAVTTHGGILFQGGHIQSSWYDQSMKAVRKCAAQLKSVMGLLCRARECEKQRLVDGMMVFAVSHAPEETMAMLAMNIDPAQLALYKHQKKIYVIPAGIDKGAAVIRLREALSPDILICAGDSEMDLSMLDVADVAVVSDGELGKKTVCTDTRIHMGAEPYARFVIDSVVSLLNS